MNKQFYGDAVFLYSLEHCLAISYRGTGYHKKHL